VHIRFSFLACMLNSSASPQLCEVEPAGCVVAWLLLLLSAIVH
jgi:hypothetical protein